jgi:hypothetical protein
MTIIGDRLDAWLDARPALKVVVHIARYARRGFQ